MDIKGLQIHIFFVYKYSFKYNEIRLNNKKRVSHHDDINFQNISNKNVPIVFIIVCAAAA